MAAATSRLELLAGAVLTPLRNPPALAKEVAAIDLISQGTHIHPEVSWQREEYEALGVGLDPPARSRCLVSWKYGDSSPCGLHHTLVRSE